MGEGSTTGGEESRRPACLQGLIGAWADRTPDASALVAPGRRPLTYGRLHQHVLDTVRTLQAMGVTSTTRLAVVLPNGPEMASAFVSIASAATCAPLNPGYRQQEFDSYLNVLGCQALIVQAGVDSPARGVARARRLPIIELVPALDQEAGLFTLRPRGLAQDLGHGEKAGDKRVSPPAGPDAVALVLPTSGTTARPKIVPLTHANLCASAFHSGQSLALTPEDRCLNVMPLFHVHGLIGALLASLGAGASVACMPGLQMPALFAWLETFRPTWYTAVPALHQTILDCAATHRQAIAACPLRLIRSCSSALAPPLMADLEHAFRAPVIEAYGMTEAAHQITSNPLPPRARRPGSVGLAAGPEVAVIDADPLPDMAPCPVGPGRTGEIVIRGPNVMAGYENHPEANRDAFVGSWFRTGDQGYLDADGYLFITGRTKELINRGGEKVWPREVDEALLTHPAVAQAVAFPVPDGRLGQEVGAAVVLRKGRSATPQELRRHVAARLADFEVPRHLLLVDEIPRTPTGKVQRVGLAARLGLPARPAAPRHPVVRPGTPAEQALCALWAELLELDEVGPHDNFFELGGDSLLAVRLFAEIEMRWGKRLSPAHLIEAPTVAQMAVLLESRSPSAGGAGLLAIQARGSRPPIFCVLPVGAAASHLTALARRLPPDQPFYALRLNPSDGLSAPPPQIADMAGSHLEAIRAVHPQGPYFLAGRCMGGLVAFEMARQLWAQGHAVPLVVLLDPSSPPPRPTLRGHVRQLLLHHLPRGQLPYCLWRDLSELATRLRWRLARQPAARRFSALWLACEQARRTYVPAPYPGRLTLLLSREFEVRFPDSRDRWAALAGAGLQSAVIPGCHARMFHEPAVRVLVRKWMACVQAALDASGRNSRDP